MHLKTTKNFTYVISFPLNFFLVGIFVFVGACKTLDSKGKKDLYPYIKKPLAFIVANPPNTLKTFFPKVIKSTEVRLREFPYLGRLIGIDEQNEKFKKNLKLRSAFRTYLNTLSLTGISDKKIAWELGKALDSQLFLFLDFTSFSCTVGCPSNLQWIIRLKLVDVNSGDLIYWVRKRHELSEDQIINESYEELAEKFISEVVNEFGSGFVVPWHQWRYFHLNNNSVRDFQSQIDI